MLCSWAEWRRRKKGPGPTSRGADSTRFVLSVRTLPICIHPSVTMAAGPGNDDDDGQLAAAPSTVADCAARTRAVFLFFIFVFYKNIFSIWKFTGIYPGRPAAGGRAFLKKISQRKLRAGPWGPVAQQLGGRPPRPPSSGAGSPGHPAAGRRATGSPTLI